ncbi:MAG: AAA family ATPase [Planctomycetes bacterium]|nr:AAA family ATPase [Planctomycetota bacterium]
MRRIAVINQKGGVGKTTTTANLGAALAEQGRRVVLVDMDAQANLSLSLGVEADSGSPTSYTVLGGETDFARALRATAIPNLSLVPSNIDLSGAELELASQIGREFLLRDALKAWEDAHRKQHGRAPADYVLYDCPPSLGLLAINALAASGEVLITLQTEFLALQGMSKLVEVVQLLRKRLNPELVITGILPCLYESRVRLAREVLGEIKQYFPGQVFPVPIRSNVKLAEAPSFGQTIFQYAPDSIGAVDYRCAAREMLRLEARDPDLASLPPFRDAVLAGTNHSATPRYAPSKRAAVAAAPVATSGASEHAPAPVPAAALPAPIASVPAKALSTPASESVVTRSTPAEAASPTPERGAKRAAKLVAKTVAPAATSTDERAASPTPVRGAKHAAKLVAKTDAPAPTTTDERASLPKLPPTRVEPAASATPAAARKPSVAKEPPDAERSAASQSGGPSILAAAPKTAARGSPAAKGATTADVGSSAKRPVLLDTASAKQPEVAPKPRLQEPTPVRSAAAPPAIHPASKRDPVMPRDDSAPKAVSSKPTTGAATDKRSPTALEAKSDFARGAQPPSPAAKAELSGTTSPLPKSSSRAPVPAPKKDAHADVIVPAPRRATKPRDEERKERVVPDAPAKRGAGSRRSDPPTAEKRVRPAPPAAARSSSTRAEEEARVVRADELPPLPPDAFEILSNFGLDP